MPRVLIAEMKQETGVFNPVPTCYGDFQVLQSQDLLETLRDTKTEVAGALDIFQEESDIEVVPAIGCDPHRDGSHGEGLTGDEGAAGKSAIENGKQRGEPVAGGHDRGRVTLVRRRPHQPAEDHNHRRAQGRDLPIHPAF